ncbi:hypothetical protein BV372_24250 [Nostoc sp. T09]|uniref:hypothetical protein n=1 Tax=Nostoc sp. T09 TaxID=1932621 RepID=UPI000A3A6F34|nr:hypothetical protein [Nostoc sp. T09]OUL28974.1 hypothetical protein BV372_24250 [Nostoc sp. T09]
MANIKVSELNLAGAELFQDSESFLNDLTDVDTTAVHGGEGAYFPEFSDLGYKVLEYGLVGFGITNIVSLVKSFSTTGGGNNGGGGTSITL